MVKKQQYRLEKLLQPCQELWHHDNLAQKYITIGIHLFIYGLDMWFEIYFLKHSKHLSSLKFWCPLWQVNKKKYIYNTELI